MSLPGRLRLPPGWSIRNHLGHEQLFYLVVEGRFLVRNRGVEEEVRRHDLVWVDGGEFAFQRVDDLPLVVLRMRVLLAGKKEPIPAGSGTWIFREAEGCRRWLEGLIEAEEAGNRWKASLIVGSLLCLYSEMGRMLERMPAPRKGLTPAQRACLLDLVARADGRWPRPSELADHLGLSHDYFTRRFRAVFGVAPRAWLLQQRMARAVDFLDETQLRIGEIAERLGYNGDVFLFSRQFRATYGKSPSAFRARR